MIADVRADRSGSRLVRDYSGLHSLMSDMDVLDEVDFDWGLAVMDNDRARPRQAHSPCPRSISGDRLRRLVAERTGDPILGTMPTWSPGAAVQGQQLRVDD